MSDKAAVLEIIQKSKNEYERIPINGVRALLAEAAELGNSLLRKNQSLQQEIDKLNNHINYKKEEEKQLWDELIKHKIDLNAAQEKLNQAGNNANGGDFSGNFSDSYELESLQLKTRELQDQLRSAIEENTNLTQQLDQKNEQLSKYKNLEKELALQRQTSSDAITKAKSLEEQLSFAENEKISLKKEISEAKKQLKEAIQQQNNLQDEIADLRRDTKGTGAPKNDKRIAQLNEKIAEQERTIANYEKEITEAKWEVKRMGEIYSDLVIQNRHLQQERKEHLRYLDEARNSVEKYKKREEESSMEASLKEHSSEDSLGGELSHLHDPVPAPDLHKASDAQTTKNREDFFHLAVASVNITGAVKHFVDLRLDAAELYKEIQQTDIPFHEWYDWIKEQYEKQLRLIDPSLDDPEEEEPEPLPPPKHNQNASVDWLWNPKKWF